MGEKAFTQIDNESGDITAPFLSLISLMAWLPWGKKKLRLFNLFPVSLCILYSCFSLFLKFF